MAVIQPRYPGWSIYYNFQKLGETNSCFRTFFDMYIEMCTISFPIRSITFERMLVFGAYTCVLPESDDKCHIDFSNLQNNSFDELIERKKFKDCFNTMSLESNYMFITLHLNMRDSCCSQYLYSMPWTSWVVSLATAQFKNIIVPAMKMGFKICWEKIIVSLQSLHEYSPANSYVLSQFIFFPYNHAAFKFGELATVIFPQ